MRGGGREEKGANLQDWSKDRDEGCEDGHHGGKRVVDDCSLFGETAMSFMAATSQVLAEITVVE